MPDQAPSHGARVPEQEFYLREFRGRTLAIAAPQRCEPDQLGSALDELGTGGARVVIVSQHPRPLDKLVEGRWLDPGSERFEAEAWRALRSAARLGIPIEPGVSFLAAVRQLAVRLGVFKLVLIDGAGGIERGGARCSFVHLDELCDLLDSGEAGERRALLGEVQRMLVEGIPSVNLCSLEGLRDELLTYAGSGTLFTRERYVTVRRLGIDDFDAASDLMARGVEEGFLAPRSPAEVDRVLASGFGAFVEGRHLAGIGALLPHRGDGAGEIASLCAITRFLGEGVGTHLVAFALERARELGLRWVFACTTSVPAGAFFERQGFRRVSHGELPTSKWNDYQPQRRAQLQCFRRDLEAAA